MLQIWNRTLDDEEIASISACDTKYEGNVLSWRDSRKHWQLSSVNEVRKKNLRKELCGGEVSRNKFLVVFPERVTIEMASKVCMIHGGMLPVPRNIDENRVRKK